MEKVALNILQVNCIKDSFSLIKSMALENIRIQMGQFTKGIGIKIKRKANAKLFIQMGIYLKEISMKKINKDRQFGVNGRSKDNLKMVI